jgi:hypothetical protein
MEYFLPSQKLDQVLSSYGVGFRLKEWLSQNQYSIFVTALMPFPRFPRFCRNVV